MTSLTISLPEDRMAKLHELAARLRVTPAALVQVSIEDLLARPDEQFRDAVEHVLGKNAELYRRLA